VENDSRKTIGPMAIRDRSIGRMWQEVMGNRWRISPHDAQRVTTVERSAGVPPVVAQLLVARGIDEPESIRQFLEPRLTQLRDPDTLPGLPAAVDRIMDAVRAGRRIAVYGDYDADGMTAAAILIRCLRHVGADVDHHIPNRLDDGYGLNDDALRNLAARGISLVVTVDCGITSVREAETAARLGLELIITDHHELSDRLPNALGLVHPRLPGSDYPFAGLCGAGVAFKLAWGLCRVASGAARVTEPLRDFLLQAIGLAAIGTVADVVPLVDENRLIVRRGLESLTQRPPVGVAALMRVTRLNEKARLTSEDIAFVLGPRLNAAGRMGQAQLAVELLTTESAERANELAEYVHTLNVQRDGVERSVLQLAARRIRERHDPERDAALVLDGDDWHLGVIGLVAGRLADKYHRPVIVISRDGAGVKPAVGSARSGGGLDLHATLAECGEFLVGHGGHAAAAGLKIHPHRIDAFRAAFCGAASRRSADGGTEFELRIDAETPFSQLTVRTVRQIEMLAPFGEGNPRPVLCASRVTLAGEPRTIGGGDRHLAIEMVQLRTTLRGVAFGKGEWADALRNHAGPLDVAFSPVINEFRGRQTVEMHLVDWRPSKGD